MVVLSMADALVKARPVACDICGHLEFDELTPSLSRRFPTRLRNNLASSSLRINFVLVYALAHANWRKTKRTPRNQEFQSR